MGVKFIVSCKHEIDLKHGMAKLICAPSRQLTNILRFSSSGQGVKSSGCKSSCAKPEPCENKSNPFVKKPKCCPPSPCSQTQDSSCKPKDSSCKPNPCAKKSNPCENDSNSYKKLLASGPCKNVAEAASSPCKKSCAPSPPPKHSCDPEGADFEFCPVTESNFISDGWRYSGN